MSSRKDAGDDRRWQVLSRPDFVDLLTYEYVVVPHLREVEKHVPGLGRGRSAINEVLSRFDLAFAGQFPVEGGVDTTALGFKDLQRMLDSLKLAFAIFRGDEVYRIFSGLDLRRFSRSLRQIEYLSAAVVPAHTAEELAGLIRQFVGHLEVNSDHLMATGYPETTFAASPWLNWLLAPLLYTKAPVSVFADDDWSPPPTGPAEWPLSPLSLEYATKPFRLGRGAGPDFRYFWTDRPGEVVWLPGDRTPYVADPASPGGLAEARQCRHELAAPLAGLTVEEASALERGREKVLALKIAVLRLCADHLEKRRTGAFPGDVIGKITGVLTPEELLSHLSAEHKYPGLGRTNTLPFDLGVGLVGHSPGGLTALLYVAGHCDSEVMVGRFDRFRSALPEGYLAVPLLEAYLRGVLEGGQADLDGALDKFERSAKRWREHWRGYEEKVRHALKKHSVASGRGGTAAHLRVLDDATAPFVEWLGRLPLLTDPITRLDVIDATGINDPPPPGGPADNSFRRQGEYWLISFGGRSVIVKDGPGVRSLAHLIRREGEYVGVEELMAVTYGQPLLPSGKTVSPSEAAGQGLNVGRAAGGGEVVDARARREIEAEVQELVRQADAAEEAGRAAELREKIRELEEYLKAASGLGGRTRRFDGEGERRRKLVRNNIRNAIERLQEHHDALHDHLSDAVETGIRCRYASEEPVGWKIFGL